MHAWPVGAEFGRLYEFRRIVRAPQQQPQDALADMHDHESREHRAVDGVEQEQASRLQHAGDLVEHTVDIGDVLQTSTQSTLRSASGIASPLPTR